MKNHRQKNGPKKKIVIAIDGTAGSGKSSLAQDLAKKMEYSYVDTGAMYRYITYLAIRKKIRDAKGLIKLAKDADIKIRNLKLKVLRTPAVSDMVSMVSSIKGVRREMVKHQRRLGKNGGVVVEGRDIGTVVFPKAKIKFFLIADIKERTKRRYKELKIKGIKVAKDNVARNIVDRDIKDSSRRVSPLRPAKDAIVIDTTEFTIKQKNDLVWKHINRVL